MAKKISSNLEYGKLYSRADLKKTYEIKDATLKNGIFRPKGYDSVLIFITDEKTSDRRQYNDKLEGDDLSMDGQPTGRTDKLLVEHQAQGLELLLFHRRSKTEHAGAAFTFEGEFDYLSHSGKNPAHFHLRRK
jgi:putative restriction endonuclease